MPMMRIMYISTDAVGLMIIFLDLCGATKSAILLDLSKHNHLINELTYISIYLFMCCFIISVVAEEEGFF